MKKVSKLSDHSNKASQATLVEVLDLCRNDVDTVTNEYNKMIIILLNDKEGEYKIQPYAAGFIHNSEVVALLEITKDIFKFSMGTFEIDE